MARWLGWAALSLLVSLGCRETTRPPPAADPTPTTPDEQPSLIDPTEPDPDPLSSCGAATLKLAFVRPNLYFAIDASGSMTESIPRAEGTSAPGAVLSNRYDALARAIQSLLARVGHRVNYGATLFPTGDVTCDAGEEIHELGPGDESSYAVRGEIGPVLRRFMFGVNRRSPRGGTPVALALQELVPKLGPMSGDTFVFLVTDGGPNCNPDARCTIANCIPNIERLRISDGFICDDEVNCCDPSLFGPENCLDDGGSLSAVQNLAAAGVHTFVIGIPGSEAYASLLDQLALAGGVARAESPYYYRVADADALTATVSTLGLDVALRCTIELTSPPPDPTRVNLYFDGELIPSDPVDGWVLRDTTTVEVVGASCTLMQTGQVLQADVIAGCPVVIK